MTSVWTDPFRLAALYLAVNALILLVLSMLVARDRAVTGAPLGDTSHSAVLGAVRAHANNAEYTPIVILTMLASASLGGSFWVIHAIGAPLTLGRLLHGYGLSTNPGASLPRLAGMVLTWIGFVAGIVFCTWLAFAPRSL
jgi:uncharacterized membrane protein YecN with MAPEG domain